MCSTMESVAIHSHKGGVGKSTIAVNLAVLLAKEGKNVCLIDADFNAPNLHTFFKVDDIKYLNDYFDDEISIDECLFDLSSQMKLDGKFLVGFSDPTAKRISKMIRLDSKSATNMLKKLMKIKSAIRKSPYNVDYLILDTTPGIGLTTINSFILTENILFIITLSNADINGTTEMISGLLDSLPNRAMLIANRIPAEKISSTERKEELMKLIQKYINTYEVNIEFSGWIATDDKLQGIEFDNAVRSLKGEGNQRMVFALDQPDHPFTTSLIDIRSIIFTS